MALLREITENLEAISGGAVDVLARVANEFDQNVSRLGREARQPGSQSTEPPNADHQADASSTSQGQR